METVGPVYKVTKRKRPCLKVEGITRDLSIDTQIVLEPNMSDHGLGTVLEHPNSMFQCGNDLVKFLQ